MDEKEKEIVVEQFEELHRRLLLLLNEETSPEKRKIIDYLLENPDSPLKVLCKVLKIKI